MCNQVCIIVKCKFASYSFDTSHNPFNNCIRYNLAVIIINQIIGLLVCSYVLRALTPGLLCAYDLCGL